jgi:hypothetical protein
MTALPTWQCPACGALAVVSHNPACAWCELAAARAWATRWKRLAKALREVLALHHRGQASFHAYWVERVMEVRAEADRLRAENARLRSALARAARGHRNLAELGYLQGEIAEEARAVAERLEALVGPLDTDSPAEDVAIPAATIALLFRDGAGGDR